MLAYTKKFTRHFRRKVILFAFESVYTDVIRTQMQPRALGLMQLMFRGRCFKLKHSTL